MAQSGQPIAGLPQSVFLRQSLALRMLLCALLALAPLCARASDPAPLTLPAYRATLESMDQVLADCQASSANCKGPAVEAIPAKLTIQDGTQTRTLRYNWLRATLDQAAAPPQKSNPTPDKNTAKAPDSGGNSKDTQSTADKLAAARTRLHDEWLWAGGPTQPHSAPASQRQALERILSQKEYLRLNLAPTLWQRIQEKLSLWVSKALGVLSEAAPKGAWVWRAIEITVLLAACIGLVWYLMRLERSGRAQSSFRPDLDGSPISARDWQLWLDDARQAADSGDWRQAVHLVYWASIARLEQSGLWPADRARTPREYLRLLGDEAKQRPALLALTRAFERTWYAGQPAQEDDYRQAARLAATLGAR